MAFSSAALRCESFCPIRAPVASSQEEWSPATRPFSSNKGAPLWPQYVQHECCSPTAAASSPSSSLPPTSWHSSPASSSFSRRFCPFAGDEEDEDEDEEEDAEAAPEA